MILFLNKLDELAEKAGGRVFKLIGNHEGINMLGNVSFVRDYALDFDIPINYPAGVSIPRALYFEINNPGFKLFMKRGSGILLKINDNVFVHGQLDKRYNLSKIEQINNWLNNIINKTNDIDMNDKLYNEFVTKINTASGSDLLWGREYGMNKNLASRLQVSNEYKDVNGQMTIVTNIKDDDQFCKRVLNDMTFFCEGREPTCDWRKLKVIIGHCPQYGYTNENIMNTTFAVEEKPSTPNNKIVVLKPKSKSGKPNFDENFVFGITMECDRKHVLNRSDIETDTEHLIYKVDTAPSRAFDQHWNYYLQNNEDLKKKYLARVPQVLQIIGEDVRIIRSTIKNMRIHQYREELENEINTKVVAQKMSLDHSYLRINNFQYGGYEKKYLKYKQKYLELKKQLNY
jgi:hypothetical protein